MKVTRVAKITLKGKNKMREIGLSNFKTYYIATVIQMCM